MAKKKNQPAPTPVRQAIKEAAAGGITKSELNQIVTQTGKSAQQVVQQMDKINQNVKQAGDKPSIALNSGAVNMLIKQAEKTPIVNPYMPSQYGTGQIGKAIQSMIGTPGTPGYMRQGQMVGGSAGQPVFNPGGSAFDNRMIGGTQIRPGGRIAVRPMGAAPAIGETPASTDVATGGTTGGGTTGNGMTGGDQFDYQSILDAIAGIQQPEFDMSALADMFNTQFEQLSSQFQANKPLQLAQLGRAYGGDAIRARQRMRKTTRDYRRSLPAQAFGQALANLAIGGGLTL